MKNKRYTVRYRRRREGKTNYKTRLKLLKSNKLRLVVRKSLQNITVQIVEFNPKGDKIIGTAHSKELKKLGWNYNSSNIPASYLTGLLLGSKIKGKVKEVIVDLGLNQSVKGSKIYAIVKGVKDSGINVNVSDDMVPDETRIKGEHIANYVKSSNNITVDFEKIKSKIKVE